MPFIIVKMWTGRSAQEKKDLIEKMTQATVEAIKCPPQAVQIAIEELNKENWGICGRPASEQS